MATTTDANGAKHEPVKLPYYEYFNVDEEIAARVLRRALRQGGDYADLFFEHRSGGSFLLEEGNLRSTSRSEHLGLGVRVVKGDASGLGYTEDLSLAGMLRAAETAASVASGTEGEVSVEVKSAVRGLDLYRAKRPSFDADIAQKVDLLKRAEQAAYDYDPRVSRVQVSFVESQKDILVVTSDGRFAADNQPLIRFNVHAVAVDGDRRQAASEGGGGRLGLEYFDEKTPEKIAEEAARIAVTMLDARDAPAGQLPVVLGSGDSGILLHEAVGHGLEADFNRKKTSNYSDSQGQMVAAEGCTVVDDGTIAGSRGSINIDDEGNAPQRNVLIEDGKLVGYMHDRLSTDYFSVGPSGNGRRQDYKHLPMPRMTNTYMLPGSFTSEEIIESVEYGVYARAFSGGQVNISNGDFVFSVTEGYLIENGKITAPVRGVNLIGNGPEILRRVSMVGDDFELSDGRWTCGKDGQSVPVGVGTPTVKVDQITVGGSQAG